MRCLLLALAAVALAGCGGAGAESSASAETGGPIAPEATDPRAPSPTPELASGVFAFATRPPGAATIADDERGLYALIVGLGSPGAMGRAVAAAAGPLSGRDAADLAGGFEEANREVRALRTGEGPAQPGAVAAALVVDADGAHVAHVGNVRVYRLRAGELERLSTDHSLVEDFIRTHETTPEEEEALRRDGPHRNVVVRALGPQPDVEATTGSFDAVAGDVFVLVTAGIHLFVDDAAIARLLEEAGPELEAMARRLVEESADDSSTEPRAAVVVRVS